MKTLNRHGLSRSELIAAIACTAVVCIVVMVSLGQTATAPAAGTTGSAHSKTIKDAAQLRGIHQSFLVFSREFEGVFPRPGLINRLADPAANGQQIPGRGPEDADVNTTANLYSVMIMMNYFSPELAISPIERNPHVKADNVYNWETYNPSKDVYWDNSFKADLSKESNASYAHMPIFGNRAKTQWRDSLDAKFVAIGDRGPKDGQREPSSFTCGPHGHWEGNVVWNDNHTTFVTSPTPDGLLFGLEGQRKPDNIFAMEEGPEGLDAIIAFTSKITAKGPDLQFD